MRLGGGGQNVHKRHCHSLRPFIRELIKRRERSRGGTSLALSLVCERCYKKKKHRKLGGGVLWMIQKCDEENIKYSTERDVGGGSKTSRHLCRLSYCPWKSQRSPQGQSNPPPRVPIFSMLLHWETEEAEPVRFLMVKRLMCQT